MRGGHFVNRLNDVCDRSSAMTGVMRSSGGGGWGGIGGRRIAVFFPSGGPRSVPAGSVVGID